MSRCGSWINSSNNSLTDSRSPARARPILALILASMFTVCGGVHCRAHAAEARYPVKPIRILDPFPPGGATDYLDRIMAKKLSERLGQPVIVDNRAGAGGNLATELAAHATPD